MRLFITFMALLSFTIFASANTQPQWLYNIKTKFHNEIIGYGIDKSLEVAKQNAYTEIAQTISTQINTQTNIKKVSNQNSYNKDVSTNLQTNTKAQISGVEVVKIEQLNDIWYVALKYDNSPIEVKLKKLIKHNKLIEQQNKYLSQTPLFKILNKEVGILNYKIIRKDNLWQIQYKDIVVPLSQYDYYRLFVNVSNKNITFKSNSSIYSINDEMSFEINSKSKGYISLLYVEHNGKVGVMFSNKYIKNEISYPNPKSGTKLQISNPYNKPIQELYIAIYSKKPIDLKEFENISDEHLDDSNYNFNKLLSILDNNIYSTIKIKIKDSNE